MRKTLNEWVVLLVVADIAWGCVPLEDDEVTDWGNEDFGYQESSNTFSPDDILWNCALIAEDMHNRQKGCVDEYEDPEYLETYNKDEVPAACADMGPFCWHCAQVWGDTPEEDSFTVDDAAICLIQLAGEECDGTFFEAAQMGPCWIITTGGQL